MSDFFTQLERHLVDAAIEPPRRRFPLPRASFVLTVAAVAATITAFAVLAPRLIGPAQERAAAPPAENGGTAAPRPATGCELPTVTEPAGALIESLAVLRRPPAGEPPISNDLAGQGPYPGAARRARAEAGREYWVVPVISAVLEHDCDSGETLTPGACLYLVENGRGTVLQCARTRTIAAVKHVMRPIPSGDGVRWEIAGIVPDGVAAVEFDFAGVGPQTLPVAGNVFAARLNGSRRPLELDAAGKPLDRAG